MKGVNVLGPVQTIRARRGGDRHAVGGGMSYYSCRAKVDPGVGLRRRSDAFSENGGDTGVHDRLGVASGAWARWKPSKRSVPAAEAIGTR